MRAMDFTGFFISLLAQISKLPIRLSSAALPVIKIRSLTSIETRATSRASSGQITFAIVSEKKSHIVRNLSRFEIDVIEPYLTDVTNVTINFVTVVDNDFFPDTRIKPEPELTIDEKSAKLLIQEQENHYRHQQLKITSQAFIGFMMSNANWGCCFSEKDNCDEFIACIKCDKKYHYACMMIDRKIISSDLLATWACPECVHQLPKPTNKENTPVRNVTTVRGNKRVAIGSPHSDSEKVNISMEDIRLVVEGVMEDKMNDLFKRFNENLAGFFAKEIKPMRDELLSIKESLTFINDQYEGIKKENVASKLKITCLEKENEELKGTVHALAQRVNQIEQHSRQCNLELQNVPESRNENLITMITKLGKVIGSSLKENDILNCTRTAKINRESRRPRSIIVHLASPRIRDEMLAMTSKYNKANSDNKLNTTHLGLTGHTTPVFVTEHLSPANKAIYAAARLKARERGYKYVWVRNGRVFMRKTDDSDYILVKNLDSLKKLI
ncbi:unnamed protein product [Parnassius mnemosyne]|uniref:FP protein C-terminal domain-containing protein n=1 Tax=Parnassius mnemosyne TaxID=213953 RepID=A0AAV1KME8_9NEOP